MVVKVHIASVLEAWWIDSFLLFFVDVIYFRG